VGTFQEDVPCRGRKMVTIVDPHVKRDLDSAAATSEVTHAQHYYVKTKSGGELGGWCSRGETSRTNSATVLQYLCSLMCCVSRRQPG